MITNNHFEEPYSLENGSQFDYEIENTEYGISIKGKGSLTSEHLSVVKSLSDTHERNTLGLGRERTAQTRIEANKAIKLAQIEAATKERLAFIELRKYKFKLLVKLFGFIGSIIFIVRYIVLPLIS